MSEAVTVYTSRNAPAELRLRITSSLERPGRTVELGWYEMRSAELPIIVTLVLVWVVEKIGDELLREYVRQSVAAYREARKTHPVQGHFGFLAIPQSSTGSATMCRMRGWMRSKRTF
jgi:hypothetical protein